MQAGLRVVRYLKSAPGKGLFFPCEQNVQMTTYSDADWASCPMTRRSVSAYFIFVGSTLVSWKSKKQDVVSRSSAEAEYRSAALTVAEIICLQRLFVELQLPVNLPIPVFTDSKPAIQIAEKPIFYERTKHVNVDFFLCAKVLFKVCFIFIIFPPKNILQMF